MKILEVNTLQTGMDTVEKDLDVQKQQLQQIEQSIQAFVDLRESFKGAGGQSIRQFFESYHLSFLKQLLSFYEEYKETLSQIRIHLQALESDSNGYIKERFLENEVTDGLKNIKEKIIFFTEEANDIMSSVSDIVSLPKLDDSYVLQGISNAEEKRDVTVGQLHTFDQQQTAALQSLEYTVQAMIQYVQLGLTLFQGKNGSIQTVNSIFYNQAVYQPRFPLYTYSSATLNQLSMWNNFYLNYVKSNPTSKVEPLISAREAEALMRHAKDSVEVIDEYNDINEVSTISGHYYTLGDGRILRQYYDATGAYKYEYVQSIPEDRVGGAKEVGSEAVSFILDFIPILSNIKAAIEAFSGEDLITGREIGDVERAVLAVAIIGGPIVKGARLLGKSAMKHLPTVQNVLNPDKVKSMAKGFYDDYIQTGIQKGTSAFKDLVKKVADIPVPFSPSLVTTNGVAFTKTIGETMKEAKETIVQMAGKVRDGVSGKVILHSYEDFRKYSIDIGKRTDLTDEQKLLKLQEAFENSHYKTDINVPSDVQYIKGFDKQGNVIYDWPPKLGFNEDSITSITRNNGLPDTWDRYGYLGGSNFADVPSTGKYSYSERAIPYVENEAAYHIGTFNNRTYFDKIDVIKSKNLDAFNDLLHKEGIDKWDLDDFEELCDSYDAFIVNTKSSLGDSIDATYGVKGKADAWGDMSGGAGQIVTPFGGNVLQKIGVLKENK